MGKQTELTLWLTTSSKPGLIKAKFFHPLLGEEILSVRGKTGGALPDCATFQWSGAVRAITSLFCGAVLSDRSSSGQSYLQGENKSLASSLDFALAKQPRWLTEMFGCDSQGRPLARRLFHISNPSRKRPGPVVLTLNNDFLGPAQIHFLDENGHAIQVGNLRRIHQLISLESGQASLKERVFFEAARSDLNPGTPTRELGLIDYRDIFEISEIRKFLKIEFRKEVERALLDTFIFSNRQRLTGALKSLHEHPYFLKLAGRHKEILSSLDVSLTSGCRLGAFDPRVIDTQLMTQEPIRLAVGPGGITTILIVKYLRERRGFNIELNYRFANSQDITAQIIEGTFGHLADAVILSPTCAARLLSAPSEFVPFMVMPGTSNEIMTSAGDNQPLGRGDFIFMTDYPSSATFFFDDLVTRGSVMKKKTKSICVEPDEVIGQLAKRQEGEKAILWWPYYMFQEMTGIAQPVQEAKDRWIYYLTTLFIHESLMRNRMRSFALDIAIRDAWLSLRTDYAFVDRAIDELLSDKDYITFLGRCNGLHTLSLTPAMLSTMMRQVNQPPLDDRSKN